MRPYRMNATPKEWVERRGKGVCPVCAKPKSEFAPHKIIYCSNECQKKYTDTKLLWPELRNQILERDNYTCKNCGSSNAEYHSWEKRFYEWLNGSRPTDVIRGWNENWEQFYVRVTGDIEPPKKFQFQVDHILAHVNGGDFWDRENLQTLCEGCHRKKTGKDIQLKARVRKMGHGESIIKLLQGVEVQKEEHS